MSGTEPGSAASPAPTPEPSPAPSDGPGDGPSDGPGLRLRYAALSDVGRHRKENQDSGYASEHLLAIADGVGGAAYGDVASSTAVHLLRRLDEAPTGELLPELAGVVHRIHDKLAEMVEQDAELDGTSTTVTAALFDGRRFGFVHIGDSRAYLFRDGQVRQITKDHTFVQTLVDEGRITEADSRVHPHRNIILRAVDGVHDTEPDLFYLDARAGDRLLLCSDGCSGVLEDSDLEPLLGADSIDAATVGLVQSSLDAGTTDNVTVVVAEVVPDTAEPVDPEETSAQSAVGPMMVGAAAAQPRRGGVLSRALFRHRQSDPSDTGEIEPVAVPLDEGEQRLDPEELRYAPRPPRRRTGLRRAVIVVLGLLLVGAVLGGAYAWTQTQYYVASSGAHVAIYKGVDLDVAGLSLSDPVDVISDLTVADLPPAFQQQVAAGIVADDLSDAHRIVKDLATQVAPCPSPTPTPSPTASPRKHHKGGSTNKSTAGTRTPAPKAGRSAGASPTPTPKASTSPSPSPTPSTSSGTEPCTDSGTSS